MKIVIDARFWGIENTGIGRYVMELISEIGDISSRHTFYLLFKKKYFDDFDKLNLPSNFIPILADIPHYSFKEQYLLPLILSRIKPDILHIPHFNIPVIWPGKLIVTIHDLIKIHSRGSQSTTLPYPIYLFKWSIHWLLIKYIIFRSDKILVPSSYTKNDLIGFGCKENKILVTYEGVNQTFSSNKINQIDPKITQISKGPYVIYTGNAYPHKNVDYLINGIKLFNQSESPKIDLILVTSRNYFIDKLKFQTQNLDFIKILNSISDEELQYLYNRSVAFVTASRIEGFGLPGLEAMISKTIVMASNSSCFPEIYQDQAIYFDVNNLTTFVEKLKYVLSLSSIQRREIVNNAYKFAKSYSWQKVAKLTLDAYDQT